MSFDKIVQQNADDELRLWIRKLIASTDEVVAFVDDRLGGGGTAKYVGFKKGSFNLAFHIEFDNQQPAVLIRFPKPGHTVTSWRTEKVENEARVMEYLRENTTIPLPRVRCWGLAEESPVGLGPFIIMDFVEGTRLSSLLKERPGDEDADMMSRLEFSHIGAISKDEATGAWSVTRRPLTYNMNELVTAAGYPVDEFPTSRFDRASDFFQQAARQHLLHLETQRNLADDETDARNRFGARHMYQRLISRFSVDDDGPFKLYCDDFRPSNMLIDPETFRITAVLDFEFTNSLPAQFSYDPPWWLLLRGPDWFLEVDGIEVFKDLYVPRMEQFLRAMERAEERRQSLCEKVPLSTRMRESWKSGQFWFDYATRMPLDVDDIYWHALHKLTDSEDETTLISETMDEEMEALVQKKMEQLKAWKEECSVRFKDDESD